MEYKDSSEVTIMYMEAVNVQYESARILPMEKPTCIQI